MSRCLDSCQSKPDNPGKKVYIAGRDHELRSH
jgi:hypothetical protein